MDYNRSSFRQCWMPDSSGKVCYECRERFTAFRRRHHCRICGQIFCSKCCNREVSGQVLGCTGGLRVCSFCLKVIARTRQLQHQQPGAVGGFRNVRPADRLVVGPDSRRHSSVETPFAGHLADSAPEALHRKHTLAGSEPSEHAESLGRLPEILTDVSSTLKQLIEEPEPDWLQDIQQTDLGPYSSVSGSFLNSSNAAVAKAPSAQESHKSQRLPFEQVDCVDNVSPVITVHPSFQHPLSSVDKQTSADTMHKFTAKIGLQLEYLLRSEGIALEPWHSMLMQLAEQIAYTVQPEIRSNGDSMNILRYVHVKTLRRCAEPSADLVYGVVCTKSVLRPHMLQRFQDPKILMIRGPIKYERTSGKFCSIDPIIIQEADHLRGVVQKILSVRPDILLVEEGVASKAQQLLSESGLTVVHLIKRSAMDRISRCVKADVLDSVEDQIFKPRMGRCGFFRTETVKLLDNSKKVMCRFEDCPPNLGCTVLLSGPCQWTLFLIKRILKHVIAAIYSARLESEMLDLLCAAPTSVAQFESTECSGCSMLISESASDQEHVTDLILYSPFLRFLPSARWSGTEPPLAYETWARYCSDCRDTEKQSQNGATAMVHPFLTKSLHTDAHQLETRRALADYRAYGGRYIRALPSSKAVESMQDSQGIKRLQQERWFSNWRHPFAHKRFSTLLSCYTFKSGTTSRYCLVPRTLSVEFYGATDVSLGAYLENFCLEPNWTCPKEGCEEKLVNHVRRFVRGPISVELSVRSVQQESTGGDEDGDGGPVVMWNLCRHCKASTRERKMTKLLWQLSFATFLNYLFHGVRLPCSPAGGEACPHCLFHDHVHFFSRNSMLALFRVHTISLFSISFPSLSSAVDAEMVSVEEFRPQFQCIKGKAEQLFDQMSKSVGNIVGQSELFGCAQHVYHLIRELRETMDSARDSFQEEVSSADGYVRSLLQTGQEESLRIAQWQVVQDSLIVCCRILAAQMLAWNCIVCDFVECPTKRRWVGEEEAPTDDSGGNHQSSNGEEARWRKQMSDELKSIQKVVSSGQLSSPFDPECHFTLPVGKVPVSVDERCPSTIIAYALATKEYDDFFDCAGVGDQLDGLGSASDPAAGSDSDHRDRNTAPLEIQFSDPTARFYCKIHFPRQFRQLRSVLCPVDEAQFIRSLRDCEPWQPTGGKSGATFFRSRDRRFIVKQMSRFEMQSFVNFAPHYFAHLSRPGKAGEGQRSLVKIFGIFRIGSKNSQSNAAYKSDMAVMEYLFYGRRVDRVYDLKGCQRNRLAAERQRQTSPADLVLLDQNLMEKVCIDSFYLHPSSKAVLDAAMHRDAAFLSANHIMDYSLLVGVDESSCTLILGIIDYLRTYTWDKRIESWVKSVSVSGQLPTVISPELYRIRFVESMDIYFPASPDQSSGAF